MIDEAVADPHDQEGDPSVGRSKVDDYPLLVLADCVGQQISAEI